MNAQKTNIFSTIFNFIMIALVADFIVLFFVIMAIAAGQDVAHVPFWDAQIKFIVNLLM